MGVKAKVLDFGGRFERLFAAYDPYESHIHLGTIKISGRNIDEMQVFTRMTPGDTSLFRWYDLHFVVQGKVEGLRNQLTAKYEEIKKGFITRKVVGNEWHGGRLADLLNEDTMLKESLQKGKKPNRIVPDQRYQCVRIIFAMSREESKDPELIVPKTMESFEASDRIAKHIRNLIK